MRRITSLENALEIYRREKRILGQASNGAWQALVVELLLAIVYAKKKGVSR